MQETHPRLIRYQEKIRFVLSRLEDLSYQPKNNLEKYGIFYSIQSIIDAIIDIIAMVIKDLGYSVQDDYSNIDILIRIKKLPIDLGDKLKKANGLRNRITHNYNGLDEGIVLRSIPEIKEIASEIITVLGEIIDGFKLRREN